MRKHAIEGDEHNLLNYENEVKVTQVVSYAEYRDFITSLRLHVEHN